MQSPYKKSYGAARINIALPVAFMIAGCAGAGQGAAEGAASGALAGAADSSSFILAGGNRHEGQATAVAGFCQ